MFNFHCKVFFFALGWYIVDSFVAALLSLLKSLLHKAIFFHLTCPDTKKKASTSLYVFQVLERKRRFVWRKYPFGL